MVRQPEVQHPAGALTEIRGGAIARYSRANAHRSRFETKIVGMDTRQIAARSAPCTSRTVILRCERSEPRRMIGLSAAAVALRGALRAHLRVMDKGQRLLPLV
jgi:hypothetical protein